MKFLLMFCSLSLFAINIDKSRILKPLIMSEWCASSSIRDETDPSSEGQSRIYEKKFECNICLTRFDSAFHLDRHYRKHTGERPYKCPFCSKCASRSDNLKQHMLLRHNPATNFPPRVHPVFVPFADKDVLPLGHERFTLNGLRPLEMKPPVRTLEIMKIASILNAVDINPITSGAKDEKRDTMPLKKRRFIAIIE